MTNTAEKIRGILNEIEPTETSAKTTQEIADILLGNETSNRSEVRESPVRTAEAPEQPGTVADLPVFEERMRLVNETWEIAYYRPIYSCRPIIGKLIVFLKRLFRKIAKFLIEPIVKEQIAFNSAATNALNSIRNNDVVFDAYIVELRRMVRENQEKVSACEASLSNQHILLEQYRTAVEMLQRALTDKDKQIRLLQSDMQSKYQEIDGLEEKLMSVETDCEKNKISILALDELVEKLAPMQDECQKNNAEILALWDQLQADTQVYTDIDYFEFENYFRGNRPQIKESQRIYIPYFSGKKHVLDLGSGRGEFLELLKENQICGTGVEPYGPFVDYCRTRGHEVVQEDAATYLRRQKEASCDGIFAAQLAEHLSTKQLMDVCKEGYRVLGEGGVMILETPNPTCLSTYTNSFYMDPSHVKPVHPKTLEYFLKKAGFINIRILYTEQSKVQYTLPLLDTAGANLAEFNDGINFLSDVIFGSQDYAIIATK